MEQSRNQIMASFRKQQRSDFQIIAAMLNACSERSKSKYQIMLNTGLNTAIFNKYVDVIVKAELASLIGIDSFFVTPKGMEYLRYHGIVESIMGSYV